MEGKVEEVSLILSSRYLIITLLKAARQLQAFSEFNFTFGFARVETLPIQMLDLS